jgi:hypothetical protein
LEYQLFLDTNALLNLGANAFKEHFVIAQKTLQELEAIKGSASKDGEVKFKARSVARLLKDHYGDYTVILYSPEIKKIIEDYFLEETPDNIILSSAYYYSNNHSTIFCTDDLNCMILARDVFGLYTKGINEINLVKDMDEYKGFQDITLSEEEMAFFYSHVNENLYDSLINEYLIIRDSTGTVVDYRRWNGCKYDALSYKQINSKYLGKIKPVNPHQVLTFDLLQDSDITIKVLSGRAGSGKDYLMIANALRLIDTGKYDKLIYVRNPIGVKDASEIGFLPGEMDDKLMPFAAPLADHLGGREGLSLKIMEGVIEIEHLGFIRGRDIKNAIIYCTEAENLTREHVQLLISRVGDGCSIWLNGDFRQTDSSLFRMNNGLLSAVQRLAGQEKFGYVQLQKTERSETAALADLLD